MPLTQQGFAFTGATLQSRHASYLAAVAAEASAASQRARLTAWAAPRGECGFDDWEAHEALGIPRSSLCLRRRELRIDGRLIPTGAFRRHGAQQRTFTVWRILTGERA